MRLDIKTAILRSGRPQYAVAQAIGVSEDRLSKFIHGRGKLSADQVARLKVILQLEDDDPLQVNFRVPEPNHATTGAVRRARHG
jgi:plasmid maintenance system antidote protein VapI